MLQASPPRILVIEDDYMIASDLSEALGREGFRVVGPVGETSAAMDLIRRERPDYAILDINLNGEMAFSVADALADGGIPFLFASGYGSSLVPARHSGVPFFEKPLRASDLLGRLVPTVEKPIRRSTPGTLNSANLLLQSIGQRDADALRPHLQRVVVAEGRAVRGDSTTVLFPESGLVVARLDGARRGSALAMIGCEGAVGIPLWTVQKPSPFRFVWETEGDAVAVSREVLDTALAQSPRLAEIVAGFQHGLAMQVAWTAQANAELDVLGKLSRMILMAADRLGPQVPLTHTAMADMLQVRRAGVTEALHKLEGEGAIRSTRCLVAIRSRDILRAHAGEAYAACASGPWNGTPAPSASAH